MAERIDDDAVAVAPEHVGRRHLDGRAGSDSTIDHLTFSTARWMVTGEAFRALGPTEPHSGTCLLTRPVETYFHGHALLEKALHAGYSSAFLVLTGVAASGFFLYFFGMPDTRDPAETGSDQIATAVQNR